MSDTPVSAELRRLVSERAGGRCEYCRIHEADTVLGCQLDHIISEKHDGPTSAANLAFACVFCNQHKGSDIASLDETGALTPLFHPRTDDWGDHFAFDGPRLTGLTATGRATIRLLRMNTPERLVERALLIQAGRLIPN